MKEYNIFKLNKSNSNNEGGYFLIFSLFLLFCLVLVYLFFIYYPKKIEKLEKSGFDRDDKNFIMNLPYGYMNELMLKQINHYTQKDKEILPILIKEIDKIYDRSKLFELTKDDLTKVVSYFDQLDQVPKYASFIDYPNKTQKEIYELEDNFGSNYQYLNEKLVEKMKLKKLSPNFFKNIFRFGALILLLKNHYYRIRPYQASQMLGLPFRHLYTKTGHHPSLPSGHGLEGIIWGNELYLENKDIFDNNSDFMDILIDIGTDIGMRRIMAGVHFTLDNYASLIIFKELSKFYNWDNENYLKKVTKEYLKKLKMD